MLPSLDIEHVRLLASAIEPEGQDDWQILSTKNRPAEQERQLLVVKAHVAQDGSQRVHVNVVKSGIEIEGQVE